MPFLAWVALAVIVWMWSHASAVEKEREQREKEARILRQYDAIERRNPHWNAKDREAHRRMRPGWS